MPDQATERQQAENEYWEQDLNPELMAGQNVGVAGPHPEKDEWIRSAYDLKPLHNRLQEYNDEDLKGIPVLNPGTRLEQGATYIDLRQDSPEEFTARGDMEASKQNWYVPKSEVDYQLWNRLINAPKIKRCQNRRHNK
jgi:hypothetical protein